MTTFDFGHAIVLLKAGRRVARLGWNGKGMYLFLAKGAATSAVPTQVTISGGPERLSVDPVVCMRTAHGTIQPGWTCSQADMLADDWTEAP